jgi:hypothetical protein
LIKHRLFLYLVSSRPAIEWPKTAGCFFSSAPYQQARELTIAIIRCKPLTATALATNKKDAVPMPRLVVCPLSLAPASQAKGTSQADAAPVVSTKKKLKANNALFITI